LDEEKSKYASLALESGHWLSMSAQLVVHLQKKKESNKYDLTPAHCF
jgi:hypothetical protein